MLVGVGVADYGRALAALPQHGEAVGGVLTGRSPAVCATAASAGASCTVASNHEAVEVKTDLKLFICSHLHNLHSFHTWHTEGSLLEIL